jgi:hypothetical protein
LGSNANIGCTAPKTPPHDRLGMASPQEPVRWLFRGAATEAPTPISQSVALAIQLCPKVRWHAVRLRRGNGADRNAKGDNQDHDC